MASLRGLLILALRVQALPCAPQSRIKVRVLCARAYHALFMHNMLIRPNAAELASFGHPDFTIFNAGAFPVNRYTSYMSSSTSVDVNLRRVPTVDFVASALSVSARPAALLCMR